MTKVDHYYMGIDPSINHTGWGIIRIDADTEEPEWIDSGIIKPPKKVINHGRIAYIGREIWEIIDTVPNMEVVAIEQPTFENSARGRTCATKGLNKLYFTAGAIVGAAGISGVPFAFITSWQWKKDAAPAILQGRVNQLLHNIPHRFSWNGTDEWEALGLALWAWRNEGLGKYEVFV